MKKYIYLSYPSYYEMCRLFYMFSYISGKVGEWAKHLSLDLNQKLNKMISLRFRDSDLIFDYRSTEMDEELKGKNDSDS